MRRLPHSLTTTLLASILMLGCGAAVKKQAPGLPPVPKTVTKDKPGGNAHDPHMAALERAQKQPWGWRTDKDMQARFPLPDVGNWTRVRFSMIPHFTGFRYGKKHHAITAAFVIKLKEGDPHTSAACIERFEEGAYPLVNDFGGHVENIKTKVRSWRGQPLIVRTGRGNVSLFFKKHAASIGWTGYPAYEDGCMIYAVAVPWRKHEQAAAKLRNRLIKGFKRFAPLTDTVPYRRE